jgi:hypothetical protein
MEHCKDTDKTASITVGAKILFGVAFASNFFMAHSSISTSRPTPRLSKISTKSC